MKRSIPLAIVITLGFLFVGYVFIPHKISTDFYEWYMEWIKAMSPFGVVLGIMSIVMTHSARIQHKVPNWQYSIVTLLSHVLYSVCWFCMGTQEGTPFIGCLKMFKCRWVPQCLHY